MALFLQREVAVPISTTFHPHFLAVVHSGSSGPIDSRSCWQSQSVQLPQRRRRRLEHHFEHHHQPLPRKAYHATSAGLAQESLLPQAGRDNIGIEENAQLGQRAMGPAHRAVSYQGHIRGQDSSRRTQKS